jgi:hypothetical protein
MHSVRQRLTRSLIGLMALLMPACSAPFNVAPPLPSAHSPISVAASDPTTTTSVTTANLANTVAGYAITVKALDPDQIYDTFGANLTLAGVLAVPLVLNNQTREPIAFRPQHCTLRLPKRQQPVKLLTPDQALSRLIKYYKVKTYNIYFYEQMVQRFANHSLIPTNILPGQTLEGVLYFATADAPSGGQLQIKTPTGAPLVFTLP